MFKGFKNTHELAHKITPLCTQNDDLDKGVGRGH